MEHKDDFTIVMRALTQQQRHNGAFFFTRDLIQQGNEVLQNHRHTFIQRADSGTQALLLHAIEPQNTPLLGHPCLEEHLTIDEWFIKGNAVLSAAHYRGLFEYDLQTLKVGVYFGQDGKDIYTTLSLLDNSDEQAIPKDGPLFSTIQEALKTHYLPFQTLFLELISLKTQTLRHLTRKTMKKEDAITQGLTAQLSDRAALIQNIEHLIQDIKTMNSYDDEAQDVRYIQYEYYLDHIREVETEVEVGAQPDPIPMQTTSALIEPETNTSTEQAITTFVPVKQHLKSKKECIHQMVDQILEDLRLANVLDHPKHEQFILVMEQLCALEAASWYLLFSENLSDRQFITDQKARLGFEALYLDAYFSIHMNKGHIEAVQRLLPLLSNVKKLEHYRHLLKTIILDKTGTDAILMCETARFLYARDEDFRKELKIRQDMLTHSQSNGIFLSQSILMTMFLNNNLEGFRFFLENHDALQKPQLMYNDNQYSILNACVLLYDISKIAFIRTLFEHEISVTHTLQLYPPEVITKRNATLHSAKHQAQDDTIRQMIVNTSRDIQTTIEDSLDFAIHHQPTALELIEEIAKHAPLKLLFTRLSRSLLSKHFSLRIGLTNNPILAVMSNQETCTEVIQTYAMKQGDQPFVACVFYGTVPNNPSYLEQFDIVETLLNCCRSHNDLKDIEHMRQLINYFIDEATKARTQPDTQSIALMLTHAGLLAWTQLPDLVVIEDYELVLRLLCLRGMVASRIYRTNADEIAFVAYQIGVLLVMKCPEVLSMLLQKTKSFQSLSKAYQLLEDRIQAKTDSGFFGNSASHRPATATPTPKCT